MNKEELTKKLLEETLIYVALGFKTEKEQEEFSNGQSIMKIMFSVPEKMIVKQEGLFDQHRHFDLNSTDGMMQAAKELIVNMTKYYCQMDSVFGWDESDDENIKEMFKLGENDILIIEGLHALNDELTKSIPSENKYKIYNCHLITLYNMFKKKVNVSITNIILSSLSSTPPCPGIIFP